MIFCKIAGALILLISGALWAAHLNAALERTRAQACEIEEWLRFVRGQIECFAMPIGDILSLSGLDELHLCGYIPDVIPRDFQCFLDNAEICDGEIREALSALSQSFGGCYREEQLKACDRSIEAVSHRREAISSDMPKRKKLNATLCISAALAIAILLV